MRTSVFLAQLLGPTLLVMGIGMIVNRDAYRTMAQEFIASRALIYIAGLLAFVPGLAIVLTHNVWVAGWPVIVTLFGWIALLGGIFRLLFPQEVTRLGTHMLANPASLTVGGAVTIVLGSILSFFGYVA
ncbi:MAG: hypothetical protein Q7V31_10905 [Parvibaculum sp.]|uniref:hypothetical protein n=1 Tax=Parvibaculum sp. TaxID=2024848 RepID=UPI00271B7AED|nr:hypothetical protein [Parvibaculum sp.]MDO8839427.1 hypothetical protein [Parvibaculum sp.]